MRRRSAFRAALALQKALGKDNSNTSTALTSLPAQLPDEGRYAEADALFGDAGRLVGGSADPTAHARLLHYRGLDALNKGRMEQAVNLLTEADRGYAAEVPAEAPETRARPGRTGGGTTRAGNARITDLMPSRQQITDQRVRSAALG